MTFVDDLETKKIQVGWVARGSSQVFSELIFHTTVTSLSTDINIFKHLKTKHCLMFLLTDQG